MRGPATALQVFAEKIANLDDLLRLEAVRRAAAFIKPVPLDHVGHEQAVLERLAVRKIFNRRFAVRLCAVLERRLLKAPIGSLFDAIMSPAVEEFLALLLAPDRGQQPQRTGQLLVG